jgi:multidrug efflux pump
VHLKLNYDTNAALTQVQAKVAQVRNDLPPEAEAPVIELQTADNQFAAMYIGFSSSDLDQNQITDYLTRVVQPKLSAVSGVQRADILGDRTFAASRPRMCTTHCPRTTTCLRWAAPKARWCR